jgi:hypothetical protein
MKITAAAAALSLALGANAYSVSRSSLRSLGEHRQVTACQRMAGAATSTLKMEGAFESRLVEVGIYGRRLQRVVERSHASRWY